MHCHGLVGWPSVLFKYSDTGLCSVHSVLGMLTHTHTNHQPTGFDSENEHREENLHVRHFLCWFILALSGAIEMMVTFARYGRRCWLKLQSVISTGLFGM